MFLTIITIFIILTIVILFSLSLINDNTSTFEPFCNCGCIGKCKCGSKQGLVPQYRLPYRFPRQHEYPLLGVSNHHNMYAMDR